VDYSTFYRPIVAAIYVASSVASARSVTRALSRLPEIPVHEVDNPSQIPEEDRTGTTVYIGERRGAPVTRCPGTRGHRCCNYLTVELYSGCPIGCTYCIMRSYLNFSPMSVVAETDSIVDTICRVARANPDTMVRVGSGETGDSLLYDPLFELSREVITGVAEYQNVYFEMKTKTACVDHLLDIERKGNAVVGFSVAPQPIIDAEEGTAASLEARLAAARRAADAGFLVSFHFDPMFYRPDWEEQYLSVVDELERFRSDRVAWISLGTFRYPAELKDRIGSRRYLYGEFVPSADGKLRYLQRIRREMYETIRSRLLRNVRSPVYLCMESEAVWRRAIGGLPEELPEVAPLFDWPDL